MLPNETIDTDPLFSMLCQWMVEDTLQNTKKKKSKPHDPRTKETRRDIVNPGTDIENLDKD